MYSAYFSSLFLIAFGFVLGIVSASSSSSPSSPKNPFGTSHSIYSLGLVSYSESSASILEYSNFTAPSISSIRHYPSSFPTLFYLTPWNPSGFSRALRFLDRATYLSPVWFQLKIKPGRNNPEQIRFELVGYDSVDITWLNAVHAQRESQALPVRVVPRVLVEIDRSRLDYYDLFLEESGVQVSFVNKILSIFHKLPFDGLVLEMTELFTLVAKQKDKAKRAKYHAALKRMLKYIHLTINNMTLPTATQSKAIRPLHFLLATRPPASSGNIILDSYASDLLSLSPLVDGFSLMAYDYSASRQQNGPNAPLNWMEDILKAVSKATRVTKKEGDKEELERLKAAQKRLLKKILLGLNFYGYQFIAPAEGVVPDELRASQAKLEPLIGRDLIDYLKHYGENVRWQWSKEYNEHAIYFNKLGDDGKQEEVQVWYPTLKSISERMEVAKKYKCGLSIWELGQGLEYFMDLF